MEIIHRFSIAISIGSCYYNDSFHIFLARLLLPQIINMYESEEGKKQLEEWKVEQEKQKEIAAAGRKSEGA